MKIGATIQQVRDFISDSRKKRGKIGFVPTMGALHEGHLSLVQACKANGDDCIMSIFVNPTQFGLHEDFSKYPRPIDKDTNLAKDAGVDFLFLPEESELFPTRTSFDVGQTQFNQVLCGPFRPGHFQGVCTIVNRFLDILQPDAMYLGQKDAQQLRILQEMVKKLSLSTQVIGVPTHREKNGLAMSSRNQYLSVEEKNEASIIHQALISARNLFQKGEKKSKTLIECAKKTLESVPSFEIQYVDLVRWEDFYPTDAVEQKSLLAIAGFMGKTRLIDNVFLES